MIHTSGDVPAWLREARNDLGVREGRDDARILAYRKYTALRPWAKTAGAGSSWCSDALCAWFERAGIASTRSAGAASWRRWGKESPLTLGAVVVFGPHDVDSGGTGHVGLIDAEPLPGDPTVAVISGNCGNAVRVKHYAIADIIACRWPTCP